MTNLPGRPVQLAFGVVEDPGDDALVGTVGEVLQWLSAFERHDLKVLALHGVVMVELPAGVPVPEVVW